jgi:hypothetical protein
MIIRDSIRAGIFIILFYMCVTEVHAQQDSLLFADSVKYTVDFKFKDGIYLNFLQVKSNSPVSKFSILTSDYEVDGSFYDNLTQQKTISYFDIFGVKQDVETKRIWGYADKGVLYVQVGGTFNRINIVGSISHFIANVVEEHESYYDPMYGGYGTYYGTSMGSSSYTTSEVRQYIMDFSTGQVLEFTSENVEILLMKDVTLYDEYVALNKKSKNQLKFYYVRKFNERNPLYIFKTDNE